MNPQPTIAILSPGDMGHAIGAVLRQHGLRILTNLQNRSARTAALAAQAGMIDVADDQTLVREADILLSVLVPAQATACSVHLRKQDVLNHACMSRDPLRNSSRF